MTELTPEQKAITVVLAHKIASLGLQADFTEPISVGPIVSVFRFLPKGSTKVAQLESIAEDFAIALGVEDVFVKRMPGDTAVGIFVPNKERQWVKWFNHCQVDKEKYKIPLILGIDYLGKLVVEDLSLMPHLLIAGSTGGGKSTLLNSILGGVILNYSPSDIQFVLSDTKAVEFNHYEGAPHMILPTATSVDTTISNLDDLITMMDERLLKFSRGGHRNILEYNSTVGTAPRLKIPYILVVIDELADLLLDRRREPKEKKDEFGGLPTGDPNRGTTIGQTASRKLAKLAQKARATGIHVIASTQRPSVKLLEGDIKSNFPARLSFRLPSEADSRTVLGQGGAEHLLARGDMLFINPNKPGLARIHAPLSTIEDIKAAIEFASRTSIRSIRELQ